MKDFFSLLSQSILGFFGGIGTALLNPEYKAIYVGILFLILLIYSIYEVSSEKEGKWNRIGTVNVSAVLGLIGAMK